MESTQQIQYGFGSADITPERPVVMDGFAARLQRSTGVLDPLGLRVLALQDVAGTRCLIVFMDLIGLSPCLANCVTDRIVACSGVDNEHIVILSSHTHSGPAAGILHGLEQDADYWEQLLDKLALATATALARLLPCTLDVVAVPIAIGVNRRAICSGRVVIGSNPSRPVDNQLRVLRINSSNAIVGAMCNTSCHPVHLTAASTMISADYPAGLYQSEFVQDGRFALFSNSGAGDINPIDRALSTEQEALSQCRAQLAEAFAAVAMPATHGEGDALLWCHSRQLDLSIGTGCTDELLERQLASYQATLATTQDAVKRYVASVNLDWCNERLAERYNNSVPNTIQATVQLIGIGGHCTILALPFEVFIETQQALVKIFASLGGCAERLLICSYANGVLAYLPTPTAVAEGGYEVERACVWYGLPGQYTADAEPTVLQGCTELMRQYLLEVD